MPSGGLPPTGGGGGPGGGGRPGGSGPSPATPDSSVYTSTEEFEALEPVLAEHSRAERDYFHRDTERFLELPREYAFDEVRRTEIDQALGYEGHVDVESALRDDLLDGAQRLARDVEAARAANTIRPGLLADAFGIAQWAIGVRPGDPAPPERLAQLPDVRLRFIVGAAAVASGTVMAAGV